MGLFLGLIYGGTLAVAGAVVAWLFGATPFWLLPSIGGTIGMFLGVAICGAVR